MTNTMNRRKYLATTFATVTGATLAGCLSGGDDGGSSSDNESGSSNDESSSDSLDNNSGQDTEISTSGDEECIKSPKATGVAGDTFSIDGAEVSTSEPKITDTYEAYNEETAPNGQVAVAINIIVTVTGPTEQTLRLRRMLQGLSYKDGRVDTPSIGDEFSINGSTYTNLKSLPFESDMFPNESTEGAVLFFLPEDFDSGAMVVSLSPVLGSDTITFALGAPSDDEYCQPPV